MPIGSILAGGAALTGIASGINNLVNSSGPSSIASPTLLNDAGAANQLYGNLFGQMAQYGQAVPQYTVPTIVNAADSIINNPSAAQYGNYTNQASQYGTGTYAPQLQGAATSMFGTAAQGTPAAQQILQSGFDPQQALYNKSYQQTMDQANAINAMNGVAGTPYGAGLTQQAAQNFNTQWQANQLARQSQAAQGYSNLVSGIGQANAGAANLGNAGASALSTYGGLPYTTTNQILGNQINAANSISSGITGSTALDSNTIAALAQYLGLGNAAVQTANQAQAQGFSQNQATSNQLGQSLSGLASLFGKSGLSGTGTALGTGSAGSPYSYISGGSLNGVPSTYLGAVY